MPCSPATRSGPKIGRCSHPSSPRAGSTTSTPSLTSPKPSRLSSTVTHKARSKTSCLGDSERRQAQVTRGSSKRLRLNKVVTDAILARRYPTVSRRIVNNPGARVSAAGFAIVVAQAVSDPELAVETGIRVDLPSGLRHQLLSSATEAVRSRLLARAPPHIFEEIRSAIATVAAGVSREMSKAGDLTAAKRFISLLNVNGELNEATLFGFAKQRKYEETVAALAVLSQSTVEVNRPLMQSLRDDGVLIPCKVAGLSWETVSAILESRFATGSMGLHELEKARGQFARIRNDNARRLLRFWQVRSLSSPSSVN